MTRDELLSLAQTAVGESAAADFKSSFDPTDNQELVELVKDIVAIANSGGGCLLIGIADDGVPSGADVSPLLGFDPAKISDRIAKYTLSQRLEFEIVPVIRDGQRIAAILISGLAVPMVFEKPGDYQPASGGKIRTAFPLGSIYFRHGAKSEPANNEDLRRSIATELDRIRESWMHNIKQVVEAPVGHVVHVLPPDVTFKNAPSATGIRITDSEDAPAFRIEDPDRLYPNRQKDVIRKVNIELKGSTTINQYDIQAILHVFEIDSSKPQYFYQSLFGPKQYSEEFVNWVVQEQEKDREFFDTTRRRYRDIRRRGSRPWRS